MTIKTGFLPTEQYDEETGEQLRLSVTFELPTRTLNNLAFELSKPAESRGDQALLLEASHNQIRVCLRKIGDKAVNVADLQGKGLDVYLAPKQLDLLLTAFANLTTASEGDVEICARSVRAKATSSGEHLRVARLPSGEHDGDKPVTREIEFAVPTRTIIQRAQEMARQFEGRSRLMVTSEGELNVIRLCLRRIGEVEYKVDDLRGDGIDRALSQKEQSCLVQVMQRIMTPSPEEKADFLSTLENGATSTARVTTSPSSTTASTTASSTG